MAWVYILKSDRDGRFYVGSTDDLERRLFQHHYGHTQTTSRMEPWYVVLAQQYSSLPQARGIEQRIKKMRRKDYLEKMVCEGSIRMKP
jgi:putative endonuclease